jgi:hypothetical protein
MHSTWNVKTNVIPVITEAHETISKPLRKYPHSIPGMEEIKEPQKTATLGTAHVLRKVLMYKHKTFSMRNNFTCIEFQYRLCHPGHHGKLEL